MLHERSMPPAAKLRRARAAALMMSCSALALLVANEAHAGGRSTINSVAGSASQAASQAAAVQAQAAAGIAQRSQQALQDAANSVRSIWAVQAAARAAALAATSNIASGLSTSTPGGGKTPGLVIDPRINRSNPSASGLWIGADLPPDPTDPSYTPSSTVTINRTASRTITTWQYFNISADTLLNFDGGITGGNVLVRVDGTASRSQILGEIKCTCQLTLINPVGWKLAGSSKVEAQSLIVAAGLDLNSSQSASVFFGTTPTNSTPSFVPGYSQPSNPSGGNYDFFVPVGEVSANRSFIDNGILPNNPTSGTGGFSGLFTMGSAPGGGQNAFIAVDPGAMIRTLPGANGSGGYIALLGPVVSNAGNLVAQNGQVILAAGSNIILQEPLSTDTGVNTALKVTSFQPGTTTTISYDPPVNSNTFTYPEILTKDANGHPFPAITQVTVDGVIQTGAVAVNNIQTVATSAGTISVPGLIISIDGAVTMVGDIVQQNGAVVASTSITRPGSVTLSTQTVNGTIITTPNDLSIGKNSVTAIVPDTLLKSFEDPTNTAYTSAFGSFIPASFDATGGTIPTGSLAGNTFQTSIQPKITINTQRSVDIGQNALIVAPSAAMTISSSDTSGGQSTAVLEAGSRIELGGLANVTVPVSSYALSILVTANEVADTPLAQALIGKTVTIDARLSGTRADGFKWVGSPILDAQGYVDTIPRTLDQILTVGGSFSVSGVGTFIQRPSASSAAAASIDVSGGYISYTGGTIKTTQLLGSDGRTVDIGKADPNLSYTIAPNGLSSPNFTQPGYLAGGNAGSVSISAITPILQGTIYGDVVTGARQRAGLDAMPSGAALAVNFTNTGASNSSYEAVLQPRSANSNPDPYGLNGFQFGSAWQNTALTKDGPILMIFPIFTDNLSASPLGSVTIQGAHQFSMTSDASLTVRPGGTIKFDGVSRIDGTLNAPGGTINLAGFTYVFPNSDAGDPPTNALVIGPHAVLNVRGLWVNDTGQTFDNVQGSAFIDGGTVTISTQSASNKQRVDVTESIVLSPGSIIDVSSGGYVGTSGKLKFGSDGLPVGKGGSLTLLTYSTDWNTRQGNAQSPNDWPNGTPTAANVVLGGTIYSGGFDGGGTLTLQTPTITIDKNATTPTATADGNLTLPSTFFDATYGFSNYILNSRFGGITVTAGTQVVLSQTGFSPFGFTGALPDSGARVRDFMPVAPAPDGLRKPVNLTLAQYSFVPPSPATTIEAGILLDKNASIMGEPGSSVTFAGGGPVAVLGSIVAPGGAISLVSEKSLSSIASLTSDTAAPIAVWIGATAKLDVSGVFVQNPRVLTSRSGTILDGGAITLAADTVIAQAGAQFALNGTSATIDVANTPGSLVRLVSQPIWSNGGTLQLAGKHIFFAGSASAQRGAPLASGGTLVVGQIAVPSSIAAFTTATSPWSTAADAIVIEPTGSVRTAMNGTNLANLPATVSATDFAAALVAAQKVTAAANFAFIEAGLINNSSFSSMSLTANRIAFVGSFNDSNKLMLPGSITLSTTFINPSDATSTGAGQIVLMQSGSGTLLPSTFTNLDFTGGIDNAFSKYLPSSGIGTVEIDAGYVRIVGGATAGVPNPANGTFSVTADWIDLQRTIAISNADAVNLTINPNSQGAVRALPDNYGMVTIASGTTAKAVYTGALLTTRNLTITAAEVYPATDTQFLLASLGASGTITIKSNGDTAQAPLSAGGVLAIVANTVEQGGTVWAPLGEIFLGNSSTVPSGLIPSGITLPPTTTTVKLDTGSVTSVSAKGLTLPYGYTVDDATWYQGVATVPLQAGASPLAAVLSTPPDKRVVLAAGTITQQTGATVDLAGGGDIYATEFVPGTGGSRNVLTTYELTPAGSTSTSLSNCATCIANFTSQYADGRQVYALVPTYGGKVAAYDPTFANYPYFSGVSAPNGTNPANFNVAPTTSVFGNGIAPGTSITIGSGNSSGIPAGTYTLLPGMYATMPGAYRVVQVASGQSPAAAQSYSTQDGSNYVVGYLGNQITGTRSALASTFQIQSASVWQRSSDIHIASANSFFAQQAQAANSTVPQLPMDGGALVLAATATTGLILNGNDSFAAADGGILGQLQISATKILVTDNPSTAPADSLVLTPDQLNNLGAPRVLIGGTADGTNTITATATDLKVTTTNTALTGSEIILVTQFASGKPGLVIDAQSKITATGTQGRDITIGGTAGGSLLRLSNGAPVKVTRTTTATTGSVTIGSNAAFTGNSITVDTSGSSSFGTGITFQNIKNYDLAASIISFGKVSGAAPGGLTISSDFFTSLNGADSVTLRSASVFNFYDPGDNSGNLALGNGTIGTLTLSGGGLFHLPGVNTTINAHNITLMDSILAPNTSKALNGQQNSLSLNAVGGTITVNVGIDPKTNTTSTLTMLLGGDGTGTGTTGGSFSTVAFNAGSAIAFVGAGTTSSTTTVTSSLTSVKASTTTAGILNTGNANVTLFAPAVIATTGSNQTLKTAGTLLVQKPVSATDTVTTTPGGILNLTASSISFLHDFSKPQDLRAAGTVVASSGAVTLTANQGDITLDSGSLISTAGSVVTVLDQTRYAPGGAVTLAAGNGAVTIAGAAADQGRSMGAATVDVSSAIDNNGVRQGYAGSLTIQSKNTATLKGTLRGDAAFNELGGDFSLSVQAGGLSSDSVLPLTSFTRSFAVALDTGDITIRADQTLTSGKVTLTANGGTVTVNGTIDASGPSGNFISLFGANGVTVNSGANLNASFRALDPHNPAAHQTLDKDGQSAGDATVNLVQNGGTITLGTTGTPTVVGGVVQTDSTNGYEAVGSSGAISVASGATLNVSGGAGGDGISNNNGSVILRAPLLTGNKVNVGFGGTVVTNGKADSSNNLVVSAYATWSTGDTSSTGVKHFDGIIDPAGWFNPDGSQAATIANGTAITFANSGTTGTFFKANGGLNQNHIGFYGTTLVNFVQNFTATDTAGNTLSAALRPEISLVNPSGDISVKSNWNLGAGSFVQVTDPNTHITTTHYAPSYRTSKGEAGTLSLRASGNINIGTDASGTPSNVIMGKTAAGVATNITITATISDGFYETTDAFSGSSTPANLVANTIANNPQMSGTAADLNPTSAASLMTIDPTVNSANGRIFNKGSFSYDFVAGARFPLPLSGPATVNPDAVASTSTGKVQIGGHTEYKVTLSGVASAKRTIVDVPTMVRTGTGSIRITAAGNFALTDSTAPGVVYTAGVATTLPAGFIAPSVPSQYANSPTGLVATPTWATNGGSVTITAGGSITGIETWTTTGNNGPAGQFWSDWYAHYGKANGTDVPFAGCTTAATACQTAAWINYNTFFQGIGALGGGNITLTAGKDITAISASLPETLLVSGGLIPNPPSSTVNSPTTHYYGGGNLTVKAGGNLIASDFLVGRGSGTISAGGNIQYSPSVSNTGGGGVLPLMLAVQDGYFTVSARGAVTLGNIYDPASLASPAGTQTPIGFLPGGNGDSTTSAINSAWSNFFTTYGPQSGVSISSTVGDVTALTISTNASVVGSMFSHTTTQTQKSNSNGITTVTLGQLLPASLDLTALTGGVTINPKDTGGAGLVPYPTTNGNATGNLSIVAAGVINLGDGISMPDLSTKTSQFLGSTVLNSSGNPTFAPETTTNYVSPLGLPNTTLTTPLHANDLNPVIVAAGQDIVFSGNVNAVMDIIKPARIEAFRDIKLTLAPSGSTTQSPLTFLGQNNSPDDITSIVAGRDLIGGAYALYGPGSFLLQAGRNLGPLWTSDPNVKGISSGIVTLGNGANISGRFGSTSTNTAFLPLGVRPYLPAKSADINLLFGVQPGIDYANAITLYVNPANAGTNGIDFLTFIAATLGKSRADAWTAFQNLSVDRQHLLVDQAFLKFLSQVASDYRDGSSPYYLKYGRAYDAISTLFPPGNGYTDNAGGATKLVQTGDLNVARSVVATQQGSDVNIIGPGGKITVGNLARDTLQPLQEGILTLAGGTIRTFSDNSILLNQSRVLTVQGGDVDIFSANGDINAGSGPKTYVSNPPIQLICDQSGLCGVNPSGLVSGAGIGALITVPGQDPSLSNVTLVAPHGVIDAGAAGLRAGGNFNAIAVAIVNGYNISVQGTSQGVPTGPTSVTATVAAPPTDQSGSKQAGEISTTQSSQTAKQPSIVIVEVLGYGGRTVTGSTDSGPTNSTNPDDKKKQDNGDQTPPQQP